MKYFQKNILQFFIGAILTVSPFLISNAQAELKLKPFETDGCTMFVDGTSSEPTLWRHCCVEHDLRYWFGGSETDMDTTDLRLKSCVQKAAGDYWAGLIYKGVRAGHYSPIKNKHNWSWAWSVPRNKVALTPEEVSYVISQLKNITLEEVVIEDFIKTNFPNQTAL
jgi:hypothetical protein